LDETELARRGGVQDEPLVVLSHGTLGSANLRDIEPIEGCLEMTSGRAIVRILDAGFVGREARAIPPVGWLDAVDTEEQAQLLTEALLMGERTGVVIRGTQVSPGIWRARGATVVEGARLEPPCLLGPGSFVGEGAILGPGAILGAQSIVEAGASVVHGRVGDGVIVGQKVHVAGACAEEGRISRHSGRSVPIGDPLLLGGTRTPDRIPRLLAAFALGAIAPVAAVSGGFASHLCKRLVRVVDGGGAWVGVRDEQDEDGVVIDVLPLLVPPLAQEEERQAARAIYRAKKSYGLDGKLLLGKVFGVADEEGGR
jgi:hypothetical protein